MIALALMVRFAEWIGRKMADLKFWRDGSRRRS